MVLGQAGIDALAWDEGALGLPIFGALALLGIGLLADAAGAARSRSLPPLAIAGAAAGGAGVLLLAVPLESHADAVMLASVALLGFAGVVYFRFRYGLPARSGEGETGEGETIQRRAGD